MTDRQRRRNEMLWRIACWMRQNGVRLVLTVFFSFALTKTGLAAEAKLDSFGDLLKTLEKEKAVKKTTETKTVLIDKPIPAQTAEKSAEKPTKQERDKKDPSLKYVEKNLQGTIVFVRKNKMSLQFGSNEQEGDLEMYFNLDKKINLKGIKEFSKLQYGDEVKVKFTETYREAKEKGQPDVVLGRVVTEIHFLKAAPKLQEVRSDAIVAAEGS